MIKAGAFAGLFHVCLPHASLIAPLMASGRDGLVLTQGPTAF